MPNKKVGRPTDNPKTCRVTARVDEKTYKFMQDYCKEKGYTTMSNAIMDAIRSLQKEK